MLAVLEAEPLLLDLIARRAGMPASTATAVLVKLEMAALVSRRPGGRYAPGGVTEAVAGSGQQVVAPPQKVAASRSPAGL